MKRQLRARFEVGRDQKHGGQIQPPAELCGGFGPIGTAAVLSAVGGAIPVGSVGYGPESVDGVYRLFAD
jgi:Family of unknown function (DUF6506)